MTTKDVSSKNIGSFFFQYAIYFVLVILILGIAVIDPSFLSLSSFRDILLQSSTRAIIALGAAFVLITGGVDLSAGRMVGFAAVLSASMLQIQEYSHRFYPGMPNLPLLVPVLIAIFAGLLVGIINGAIIAWFSVPPFIATLGSMVAVYGLNSLYFDMKPNQSQPIGGLRPDFTTDLGSGYIGTGVYSIPYIVIIALIVALIVWVIFNKTRLGKSMYAIGGNIQAAIVSGINVKRVLLYVYAIAGALYGLAGVMEAARTGGATNNYGNMYELDAIAACVVGGVSTAGGIGTVPGVLVGVLIFGVINYGLTYIGVSPYWQLIIKGLIIIAAVAFDIRKYLTKK
ncbi:MULTISPECIES: galactose/methyl galactoside ABC transporter permease MglC [Desulfosporosinus]|uniref:Galactoside transport system permease protein MglC n=1 Tax=Desulfosporosinus acididurans TaxID=476652 RepID=A0A0J1ILG7_9FIRM|nr:MULTISPECIES: galactose/methyl galactoside ABC transporter permease MglC [Desulfosporosinus]KLU65511.1 galactoside transport system permease protein MglC [Desulfosporosinus acididurans]